MACKGSAVRSRLAPPVFTALIFVISAVMCKEMYRFGRIAVNSGVLCIIAGTLIGFSVLLLDWDNTAIIWLSLIPLGFILLFTGTVTCMLFGVPHSQQDKEPD